MSHDRKRLTKIREAMPAHRQAPLTPRSLSLALGWEVSRWWTLEQRSEWTDPQRAEAEEGLRAICAKTNAEPSAVDSAVAFLLSGEGDLGGLSRATWNDGRGPARQRGRKRGTRVVAGQDGRMVAVAPSVSPLAQAATTVAGADSLEPARGKQAAAVRDLLRAHAESPEVRRAVAAWRSQRAAR